MTIDPSKFHRVNVTDTCAVWNVLSSEVLFRRALTAGCDFCCTAYVEYETLVRRRTTNGPAQDELRNRLLRARELGCFKAHTISVQDLTEIARLQVRKRLGMGELSSIAFAQRIGQALLTDDRRARRLAADALGPQRAQSSPHLLAWLYYAGHMSDGDVSTAIAQHEEVERPLRPHFLAAHELACRARLMDARRPHDTGSSNAAPDPHA